ncbi:hypothetical protein [Mycobacteroides sp. LB1]|uniref:hypothetical protein n=1 Tax=Mycobacteroides sp. LB1 TaxID=2750814 RepID=UPI0015DECAD6|nr:hypothetical protein [Mycobacteroides sp. LB1]
MGDRMEPGDLEPDKSSYTSDITWMTEDDQQVVQELLRQGREHLLEHERQEEAGTLPPSRGQYGNQNWPIGMSPDGTLNVTGDVLANWKPGDKPIDLGLKKWKEESDQQERQRQKKIQQQVRKGKRRAFLRRIFGSQ